MFKTDSQIFSAKNNGRKSAPSLKKYLLPVIVVSTLTGCRSIETPLPTPQELDGNISSAVMPDGTQYEISEKQKVLKKEPNILKVSHTSKSDQGWSNSIEAIYNDARLLVEKELDISLKNIRLLQVEDDALSAEVRRESRRLIEAQFNHPKFTDSFLDKLMGAQVGTYVALFTSQRKAIMVSRSMLRSYENSLPADPHIRQSALKALLIHELVHAADDLRYRIHENRTLNFRASFAQSATFEGHAQWATRKICALHGCLPGLSALDDFMFNRSAAPALHAQPIEAISHNVLEYSYVEGEKFITALADRQNGNELIDNVLSSPPQDPIQILAPETFPDIAREQRNQTLIRASLDVDHPWVKGDWIGVQTSPLKGVNLRSDLDQRRAAIDGFTRLINGMVSMQLYDQTQPDDAPMEVTILQTDYDRTATLFARTLHENAIMPGTSASDEAVVVNVDTKKEKHKLRSHLYRSVSNDNGSYRTTIAVSGSYLVQISGNTATNITLDDYALRVLLNLHQIRPNL